MRTSKATGTLPHNWIILILWLVCASMFWHPEPTTLGQLAGSTPASYAEVSFLEDGPRVSALTPQEWQAPAPRRLELSLRSQTSELSHCHAHGDVPLPPNSANGALRWRISSETAPPAWLGLSHPSRSPPFLA